MNVDVVVPIYNESKTLKDIITMLLDSRLFNKVICVDDGSTDDTLKILRSFENDIETISYIENKGKGNAMAEGIKAATADVVLFTDADFLGLSKEHLTPLIEPLKVKSCDATIGRLDSSIFKFFPKPAAAVSGQRAYFRKDLLPIMEPMRKKRFGVEVFLNEAFKDKNVKTVVIKNSPKHLFKHDKRKPHVAAKEYMNAAFEIGKEVAQTKIDR